VLVLMPFTKVVQKVLTEKAMGKERGFCKTEPFPVTGKQHNLCG